jgi:CubicO group peptidase (beta-lactamase class C family)
MMKRVLSALLWWFLIPSLPATQILPEQVMVDNLHPHTLRQFGKGPVFICGPGDPEDFLYRGILNQDGTREGDQDKILSKLIQYGGNCLYFQAVRSHGGDGEPTHNPFLGHDPAQGINQVVLDQWEQWFKRMDEHHILIYFFLYDDSADPWKTGKEVSTAERLFVESLVNRFEHHPNLIWILAEESEEALAPERALALGSIIAEADDHGHLIGNHHHSGTEFKSWTRDGPFDHYAMQLNVPLPEVHARAIEASRQARDRYQVIWSENTAIEDSDQARRRFAWECAMGGLMPMLLNMNVAKTSDQLLKQCRILSTFFEQSSFQDLRPADEHAAGQTEHVLSNQRGTYIAYTSSLTKGTSMMLTNLPGGTYEVTWLDCQTGTSLMETLDFSGLLKLKTPYFSNPEVAVHLVKIPKSQLVFPGEDWEQRRPDQVGMNPDNLAAFIQLVGGRGVIIRNGYLVHGWGDYKKAGDLASASKPIYSHLLLAALDQGKLKSPDKKVSDYYPCLADLNPGLGYKDRELTVRHLAFQTASLGYQESPGAAFDYNDHTMGLFWNVVIEKIYGTPWQEAHGKIFDPLLVKPLQLQDGIHFATSGGTAGRPRMSPRDFARLGLLYLNHGLWKEQELLSPELTRLAVTDPLPLTVPRTRGQETDRCATRSIGGGGNQADHNGGYSWLWWVNGYARDGQRWWKDAPANMFTALGHCGQRGLAVFPDQQLIVSWNDTKELHCNRELGNRAFRILVESCGE